MKTTLRNYLEGRNFKISTASGLNVDEFLESTDGESLYLFFECEKPAAPQKLYEAVQKNLDNIFKFSHFPLVGKVTYGILCAEESGK